jgi:hypothetical protein
MTQRMVWLRFLLIPAWLWMTGCAYTQRLTVNPLEPHPSYEKIPLRATLVLSDALCTYTFRTAQSRSLRPLRRWVYPIGQTLCAYADRVARHSFTDVVVTQAEATTGNREGDVLITPRLVAILMYFPNFPQSLWEQQEAEVIFEWTITNRTGHLLWAHTAGGVSQVAAGTFLNRARRNRQALQQAVDEVFRTFRDRLVSAPELRTLATSQR